MPYDIRKTGSGNEEYCIYKTGTDTKVGGCHPTHEAAARQIAAIEASETYRDKSTLLEASPDNLGTEEVLGNANVQGSFGGQEAGKGEEFDTKGEPEDLRKKVKALWLKAFPKPPPKEAGSFGVYKDKDGNYRWWAVSSTSLLDKHAEVVSTAGMDASMARAEERNWSYGNLNFWHLKGLELGSCDTQMRIENALFESGQWYDTPVASAARTFVETSTERWGVSIEFIPLKGGPAIVNGKEVKAVWEDLQIVGRALLPKERAANGFTAFGTTFVGGNIMDEEKLRVLEKLLGKELAQEAAAQVDSVNLASKDPAAVYKAIACPFERLEALANVYEDTDKGLATVLRAILGDLQEKQPEASPPEDTEEAVSAEELKEALQVLGTLGAQVKELHAQVAELREAEAPKALSGVASSGILEELLGLARKGLELQSKEDTKSAKDVPQAVKNLASVAFGALQGP